MLWGVHVIAAILATAGMIFQAAARPGAFGRDVQETAVRNSHLRTSVILGAVLWVAWA
jgi:hypothetical protein